MNQLDSLKKFSTIVADSGDIDSIRVYKPQNATTNPSLILKAATLTKYCSLFEDALIYSRKKGGNQQNRITNASDKLIVNIGIKILEYIPGHVSTEIDARLSYNLDMMIEKAHKLINIYQEQGINKSRVLIKIAATWEGIKAAAELKKNNIKCNLTLLFSFIQAQACAESNIYLISPFVGRIFDWYNRNNLMPPLYSIQNDPGIQIVKKIFYYYKKNCYNTIIMAASFRTIEQVLALSGCDCLTISPKLLEILSHNKQPIICQLTNPINKIDNKSIIPLSKAEFMQRHNQNKMAVELLTEGIQSFSADQQNLDNLIAKQL